MERLFLVCLGGAFGSGARFALSVWLRAVLGAGFPYGTLAVNMIGSFLLGVVMRVGLSSEVLAPTVRLALGTGVLGGFTTYSTFNYETLRLFEDDAILVGFLNIAATLGGCMVAGWLGVVVGRRLVGP